MSSPEATTPKGVQRTSCGVAVAARHGEGSLSVALTSQDPTRSPSTPAAEQKTIAQRDRPQRSLHPASSKAQRAPAEEQCPSPTSKKAPFVAASPTASMALSTPQRVKPSGKKPSAYSSSRAPLDSSIAGPNSAQDAKEPTQKHDDRDVPGCAPLVPIPQSTNRPARASRSPSPRAQPSQAQSPKSGRDSMKALSDLLLDTGQQASSSKRRENVTELHVAVNRSDLPL
ncbi:uncharacterized protein LOC144133776 [Amblyomma americanum]